MNTVPNRLSPSHHTMSEHTTLTIRVGRDEAEHVREETHDRIKAAERGDELEERHVLVLEDESALSRLITEPNLELIQAIRQHEPSSMREAAELVGRGHKEVNQNLTVLEALNVIDFVQEGRSKRPVVSFDEIEVDIPVAHSADSSESAIAP
jgi:predicted transcriptional regulator